MRARWLARAAFVLMLASAAVLIGFPERHARGALVTVAIGAFAACLIVGGGYGFLAHRGVLRQLGLGLVVLVPVAVLAVFAWRHVIWVAVVAVVLLRWPSAPPGWRWPRPPRTPGCRSARCRRRSARS